MTSDYATPGAELEGEEQMVPGRGLTHIRSFDRSKKLCGLPMRDATKPVKWQFPSCVVCQDIWDGMSFSERLALVVWWSG